MIPHLPHGLPDMKKKRALNWKSAVIAWTAISYLSFNELTEFMCTGVLFEFVTNMKSEVLSEVISFFMIFPLVPSLLM